MSVGPFPQIKVYECGKCLRKDFQSINALWTHFETCGNVPAYQFNDWE